MKPHLLRLIIAFCAAALFLQPAHAIDIKEVTSPGGIKAWLVESNTIPLIAMDYSFEGGATSDPAGKAGTANFLPGLTWRGE